MRKNELLHLHALLIRVAEEYIDRGLVTPDEFAAYRALDVTPTALREPRDSHQVAVQTLARTLAAASRRSASPAADTYPEETAREPNPGTPQR